MKRKKRGSQRQRQAYRQAYRLATIAATAAVLVMLFIFMLERYPAEFPFFWYYLVMITFTLLGIIFIAAIAEDIRGMRGQGRAERWQQERKLLRARLQAMEAGSRMKLRKLGQEHAAALHDDARALRVADGLLARLPDAEIERFAASGDFPAYKKAMERHRIR
ncbi:MAG TPA: hypothetical protein VJC16_01085 [Candidatus Nanoarchaeia archaeon]|nr:hypothetical protein [Candidatus Nanoarchaeia archaeon]